MAKINVGLFFSIYSDFGFYTGIFGFFNGRDLDSAVSIRFMEEDERGMVYKSGGGITVMSRMEEEYREAVAKVYVPFDF